MIELIQMLFSWSGILTLIIAIYVIDDVFCFGWKEKIRKKVVGDDILNNDPEILLLKQDIINLKKEVIK